jgi:hypothetical protein
MRQYFGDEKFYESFDKVQWVYDSAERKIVYASFSPGEGSLTSNFLYTHRYKKEDNCYLEVKEGTFFAKGVYKFLALVFNRALAQRVYRHLVIHAPDDESYLFDRDALVCFRIDWSTPLDSFPSSVPRDIPDIIFQMGSGLYGVRDSDGVFDEDRYKKTMCFAKMTEIKMAQGGDDSFDEYANLLKKRLDTGSDAYPDFITIDGGDSGSGAAPLEMML